MKKRGPRPFGCPANPERSTTLVSISVATFIFFRAKLAEVTWVWAAIYPAKAERSKGFTSAYAEGRRENPLRPQNIYPAPLSLSLSRNAAHFQARNLYEQNQTAAFRAFECLSCAVQSLRPVRT